MGEYRDVEEHAFLLASSSFVVPYNAEVGGFFKLAEPLVARVVRRQMETDMATLKDLLEAGEAEDR